MLSFPLFHFLLPDGIRQHIKAVLYECKGMINLGQCYEVCRTILFDNTCIYSCKKKQNVSPGEKKNTLCPHKGFLVCLSRHSTCRALGHETPIPGGLSIWSHTIIVLPYLICFKLQIRAVKITFCSFQRKSKKIHESGSESSESASTSADNDTDILSDDDSSSDTSNGKVLKIFISAFYYIACGPTTCLLLFLVEFRIKSPDKWCD